MRAWIHGLALVISAGCAGGVHRAPTPASSSVVDRSSVAGTGTIIWRFAVDNRFATDAVGEAAVTACRDRFRTDHVLSCSVEINACTTMTVRADDVVYLHMDVAACGAEPPPIPRPARQWLLLCADGVHQAPCGSIPID
jgi:hypothetical protein